MPSDGLDGFKTTNACATAVGVSLLFETLLASNPRPITGFCFAEHSLNSELLCIFFQLGPHSPLDDRVRKGKIRWRRTGCFDGSLPLPVSLALSVNFSLSLCFVQGYSFNSLLCLCVSSVLFVGLKPLLSLRSTRYACVAPARTPIVLQKLFARTTTFYEYLESSPRWTPTGQRHPPGGLAAACRAPPARLYRSTRCGDGLMSHAPLAREKCRWNE